MRRIVIMISLVLIAALSVSAKGKKQLVILHTNDTHSCIMPLNPHLADTMLAGRGMFLRLRMPMIWTSSPRMKSTPRRSWARAFWA